MLSKLSSQRRSILYMLLSAIFFGFSAAIVGCNQNPCATIVCRNNGTCREGACACPIGYEGSYCENKASDKIVGYWEGFTRCNGGPETNVTLISTSGKKPNEVEFYNIFSPAVYMKAVINGVKFTIDQQSIGTALGTYSFRGNGYVERIGKDQYIHLWYEETDPVGIFRTCYFEAKRIVEP